MPTADNDKMFGPPPWVQDGNRVDVNLIAMLLWQAFLTGTAVAVSHTGWYLDGAGAFEMGLQYGLIAFGFLCSALVLFQVGGIRDSLAMRAEFAKENQVDKWMRSQMRLQQRRFQKQNYISNARQQMNNQQNGNDGQQMFGYVPYPKQEGEDTESGN